MSRRLFAFLLAALSAPALAQSSPCPTNYAQVTALRLGALQTLQNGMLYVTATAGDNSTPIDYSVPGVGAELLTPKKDPIVAGTLLNTLCLARSDRSSVPIGYHFIARDTSPAGGNRVVLDIAGVPILSDTFSLDSYSYQQPNAYALQNLVFAGLAGSTQTPGGTENGTNTTFSLTGSPSAGLLYRNGVLQQPAIDYNLSNSGNTLTFTQPPQPTDVLLFIAISQTSTNASALPGSFGALSGSPFDNAALNTALSSLSSGKAMFSQLGGAPTDNASLAAALNAKAASNASFQVNGQTWQLGGTYTLQTTGAAPSASNIQSALQTQSGCTTAGYLYSPFTNSCVAPANGATPTATNIQTALQTQSGCTTPGYVYIPQSNTCVAPPQAGSASAAGPQGSVQVAGSAGALAASVPLQEFNRPIRPEMYSFLAALKQCQTQVVPIDVLSDSRYVVFNGDGSNSGPIGTVDSGWSNRTVDRFTSALVADTGCAWHGTGLIPFVKFLVPGSPNPNNLFYTGTNSNWTYDTSFGPVVTIPSNAPATSIAGQTWSPFIQTSAGFQTTWTTSAIGKQIDTVIAYCESGPGLSPMTISVTGGSSASCGGSAGSKSITTATISITLSTPSVVITCPSGTCGMYGVRGTVSTVGIEVNPLGAASGFAEQYSQNAGAFAGVDALPPPYLVITEYGTNDEEPNIGFSLAQDTTALNAIVNHVKAYSTAPSVLMTFPPSTNNQTPTATAQAFAANAYSVANSLGAGWDNVSDAWGYVLQTAMLGSDQVHPSAAGASYECDLLIQAAMGIPTCNPSSGAGASGGNFTGQFTSGQVETWNSDTTIGRGTTLGEFAVGQGTTANGQGHIFANYWKPYASAAPTGTCSPAGSVAPAQDGTLSICGAAGSWSVIGSSSTYNAANVAITGGDISAVTLGLNAGIKSLSVANPTAGCWDIRCVDRRDRRNREI